MSNVCDESTNTKNAHWEVSKVNYELGFVCSIDLSEEFYQATWKTKAQCNEALYALRIGTRTLPTA